MNNESAITNILFIVLSVMIAILVILVVVYIVLSVKSKNRNKKSKEKIITAEGKNSGSGKSNSMGKAKNTSYNEQAIYDFMEFDKIEDNMIVQKNGKRYLMVIECQGVNYDLMSNMEKVAVEEGFQQFLNTLRHPIQIYIQTRTINLESSIQRYKEQVKQIEDNYKKKKYEYDRMIEAGGYNRSQLEKQFFELTKQKNMLEYSRDLINNTEKMNLNRNILNKKYYIIISYYPEETNSKYEIEEIKNMAFSELYTKAQALIRTLSACSVSGKILNSKELIELLYVAYNRDESEVFGVDKAMRAGYEDLYSTAPDVFEKKIKVLNEQIQNKAIDLANEKIEKAKSRAEQIAEEQEKDMDTLIGRMAEIILQENKRYVGEDIAEDAIREIKEELGEQINKGNNEKEEGEENEQIKKTSRGRKRKAS